MQRHGRNPKVKSRLTLLGQPVGEKATEAHWRGPFCRIWDLSPVQWIGCDAMMPPTMGDGSQLDLQL